MAVTELLVHGHDTAAALHVELPLPDRYALALWLGSSPGCR